MIRIIEPGSILILYVPANLVGSSPDQVHCLSLLDHSRTSSTTQERAPEIQAGRYKSAAVTALIDRMQGCELTCAASMHQSSLPQDFLLSLTYILKAMHRYAGGTSTSVHAAIERELGASIFL